MITITFANTWWQRLRGLVGKQPLLRNEVFFIPRCQQVHTWFMRYMIDIVWLDVTGKIVAFEENIVPWRVSKKVTDAQSCVELKGGEIRNQKLYLGAKFINSFEL